MLGNLPASLKRSLTSSRLARKPLRAVWILRSRYFDWRHGVETTALYGGVYEPIGTKAARLGLELGIDYPHYTFIDFGSGKGRVLLLASEYPYKKIIGVELSEELHQTTLRNIRSFRSNRQKCRAIESIHMDAAEFPIPESPLVLHFFNPFRPSVMSRVLANVQASLQQNPRDAIFIYQTPRDAELFEKLRNIELIKEDPWLKVYRIPGPVEPARIAEPPAPPVARAAKAL